MKKMARNIIGLMIISVAVLVVASCSNEDSATLVVSEFRDYIEKGDGEGLYEDAVAEEETHWTVDDAANVVKMLKDDEEKNAELMGVLAAQGQHYDADGDKNKAYDLYEDVTKVAPFYIDEVDGEYVIHVRTYDVTLVTEPAAEIEFLEETYIADDQGEINLGELGPGYYELNGTLETDDGTLEAEESFFIFDFETFTQTEYVDFETK